MQNQLMQDLLWKDHFAGVTVSVNGNTLLLDITSPQALEALRSKASSYGIAVDDSRETTAAPPSGPNLTGGARAEPMVSRGNEPWNVVAGATGDDE